MTNKPFERVASKNAAPLNGGVRRLRKLWLFWLPAIYVALLFLAGVDIALGLTGNGEANLGAWMYIFSFAPAMLVAKIIGVEMYFPPPNPVTLIVLQALGLMLVGAIVDAIRLRRRS